MHTRFYGLTGIPFAKGLPSDKLFASESQKEALSRMHYAASCRQFLVLTGDCGTGKTTVLRRFFDGLDAGRSVGLYLTDSRLTPRHFYNGLLSRLGRDGSSLRGDLRRRLHEDIEYMREVRNLELIVAIDEAHLLGRNMLEEIRFLLNFKMDSESPLTLVLCGQPELLKRLDMKGCAAIRQRMDLRYSIAALDCLETSSYIGHHLKLAGASPELFSDSAIKDIFSFSEGSIRLINKICISCLLYGASKERKVIDEHIVKHVIGGEL
jgi:type II secretory pathway predicted ATPase ExeA